MTADPRPALLARVADMRGRRLERAASEARSVADDAAAAADQAHAERAAAMAARVEARAMFQTTPACPQTRLWLDRTLAGETGAVAILAECSARLDMARDAHAAALTSLAQHQVRSDIVAEHHRALRRADARRAEERVEADMPVTPTARRV